MEYRTYLQEAVATASERASFAAHETLLSIDISAAYPGKQNVLRHAAFNMGRKEILGLAGQSGSGKSTLALSILRLLGMRGGTVEGAIHLLETDLMGLSERDMRSIRGRHIGFVPQSPATALNPALSVGTLFSEAWRAHAPEALPDERALELLRSVSLPPEKAFLKRRPAQLSLGQGQRLLIAMAIIHRPELVIADEPTSALDVITQSEILKLFAELNQTLGTGLLYISHDLLSIAGLCHRVALLNEGAIVEIGTVEKIFQQPDHAYSRRLMHAIPKNPFRR